jgi:hypothetical protein
MVRAPVGPVSFGSTAVGAEDDVAIVAPKSGCLPLESSVVGCAAGGCAAGGVNGAEARNVALGSNGWSGPNRPPSMVQNF